MADGAIGGVSQAPYFCTLRLRLVCQAFPPYAGSVAKSGDREAEVWMSEALKPLGVYLII